MIEILPQPNQLPQIEVEVGEKSGKIELFFLLPLDSPCRICQRQNLNLKLVARRYFSGNF
ncbi:MULTISPECIES: hypothetical protein [unclassified Microcoleus]|uniref:hypothetical protein n=1 Tax=unclassified Microcoleus TaxID=2642155 RepID=UPI002FD27D68